MDVDVDKCEKCSVPVSVVFRDSSVDLQASSCINSPEMELSVSMFFTLGATESSEQFQLSSGTWLKDFVARV